MVEFYDPVAGKNISYHIAPIALRLWDNLREDKLKRMNEDRVYIVDGRERTGKSSFAFQQAKYIDPTFTLENICFKPEDFLDRIRNAPQGSVIVFDEAFRGLSSKGSRSKVNKAIVQALMEVGQRNLIIFIVLPTIFLLEIYAAVFRSEALFHIYKTKKKMSSGARVRAFKVYNYKNKKYLYLRGKTKYFSYAQPKIRKEKGEFYVKKNETYPAGIPYETFDMDAYNKKKAIAFKSSPEANEEENKYQQSYYKLVRIYREENKLSETETSERLIKKGVQISPSMVGKICREYT